jgi:chemotaxis protein CheX
MFSSAESRLARPIVTAELEMGNRDTMITNDEVLTITQNVLGIMLDMEPETGDEPEIMAHGKQAFIGRVDISGQWQGTVVVQATPQLARLFAARFFEMALDEVNDSDIRDAVTELTNMIGGNIKGQVPAPSYLSIPSVTYGSVSDFLLPGSEVVTEVATYFLSEPLRVALCENRQ